MCLCASSLLESGYCVWNDVCISTASAVAGRSLISIYSFHMHQLNGTMAKTDGIHIIISSGWNIQRLLRFSSRKISWRNVGENRVSVNSTASKKKIEDLSCRKKFTLFPFDCDFRVIAFAGLAFSISIDAAFPCDFAVPTSFHHFARIFTFVFFCFFLSRAYATNHLCLWAVCVRFSELEYALRYSHKDYINFQKKRSLLKSRSCFFVYACVVNALYFIMFVTSIRLFSSFYSCVPFDKFFR